MKLFFIRNICKIAKSYYWLRYVCLPVYLSVCENTAPTGRIFMKFDIRVFFRKYFEKKLSLIYDKNNGYFT